MSDSNLLKDSECAWVLSALGVHPATHCRRLTTYKMVLDDDERSVRKYDRFCAVHKKMDALMKNAEAEDAKEEE